VPYPDLPDTKGELAVPIRLRDQVPAVLDVHSDVAGALSEEDQIMLMGLAGQIATLESPRPLEQTHDAPEEADSALQPHAGEPWTEPVPARAATSDGHTLPGVVAVGCLLAAGLTETLAVWADPGLGLILRGLVLLALFLCAAFDRGGKVRRLCLALALVPLIRIVLATLLSPSLSTVAISLLLVFLVLKELASTLEGGWQVFGRSLNIAIVPLLITFFATIVMKAVDVLR
jgi:hypothetical protein